MTLAKCRRYRGTLSCADRASEGGGQSHLSCVRVGFVPSLGGKGEAKNDYFFHAPGGAQLLALDKAVHPLAAAEVELPLDAARAGL